MLVLRILQTSRMLIPASGRTGWLWWLALLCLMILPFGLVWGNASTDIPMTLIALLFVAHSVMHRDWAWWKIRWVPLAFVIWLYYIAISFQAIEVVLSLKGALAFGRFIFFGIACQHWLFSHARVRRWMLWAIAAACVFAAFDTWFQFLWGSDLFGVAARSGASWLHPIFPWEQVGGARLNALSGRPKIGGTIIMMAGPALVYWLSMVSQPTYSTRKKIYAFLAAFMVLLIVPLTGERTSTMWMVLTALLAYLWVPQTRRALWYMVLPFILSIALVFHTLPALKNRMLGEIAPVVVNAANNAINHEHKSDNIYSALNRTAINLYLAHPIWGVGLKQFDKACRVAPDNINKMRPYRPGGGCNNSPQNIYLELMVNTGTVGTLLFLALMGMWAIALYRHRHAFVKCEMGRLDAQGINRMIIANQPVMLGVLVALALRLFPFVTTTSFYFSWGGLIFWWMGAWLLAYCDAAEDHDRR